MIGYAFHLWLFALVGRAGQTGGRRRRAPLLQPPAGSAPSWQDLVLMRSTDVQAARLGNAVHAMIMYRRKLDREDIKPVSQVGPRAGPGGEARV